MIQFILNNELVKTAAPAGTALLDFIRKNQFLTGTKLVCKEGECGACTVLIGSWDGDKVYYQSMTSCITPLINVQGKHVVTVEGLNMEELSPVQAAMASNYGTQCGFCTPGFVVSLTGFLLNDEPLEPSGIISCIDGNICRCTGYKSIERAGAAILQALRKVTPPLNISRLVQEGFLPDYFLTITERLPEIQPVHPPYSEGVKLGGGSDLYVQRPYELYDSNPTGVFDQPALNDLQIKDGICVFGASRTMGDLYRSPVFQQAVPNMDPFFKLLSSTQIRNMATIGGNLVNASPIGDFTIFLLALDSTITLELAGQRRKIKLKEFYHSYKVTDLKEGELLTQIEFDLPSASGAHLHFEKVSQRKYLDIASVNFASSILLEENQTIRSVHLAVGGVGPIPLYLKQTTQFLMGKQMTTSTIDEAIQVMYEEISPISDARGSVAYKRLLARQLLVAQFLNIDPACYEVKKWIGHE